MIPITKPKIPQKSIQELLEVLDSGMLVYGQVAKEVEEQLAKYINITHFALLNSGTSTLHAALLAENIGVGDEVIVPAFSYVATANVVELVGATPVFCDIKLETCNIDAGKIDNLITDRTRAIIPVHEFGLPAELDRIMEIAEKNNLIVIEDAACALGAQIRKQHVGSFGHYGSFSFHPRKNITSGEGGGLVVREYLKYKTVQEILNHGWSENKTLERAGYNYRLSDIQAALLKGQLPNLEKDLAERTKQAQVYKDQLKSEDFLVQSIDSNYHHAYQSFHVVVNSAQFNFEDFESYMRQSGVQVNYGAQCIPNEGYYRKKYNDNISLRYPNALMARKNGFVLPLYPGLSETEQSTVIHAVNNFFK